LFSLVAVLGTPFPTFVLEGSGAGSRKVGVSPYRDSSGDSTTFVPFLILREVDFFLLWSGVRSCSFFPGQVVPLSLG